MVWYGIEDVSDDGAPCPPMMTTLLVANIRYRPNINMYIFPFFLVSCSFFFVRVFIGLHSIENRRKSSKTVFFGRGFGTLQASSFRESRFHPCRGSANAAKHFVLSKD